MDVYIIKYTIIQFRTDIRADFYMCIPLFQLSDVRVILNSTILLSW